MSRAASSQNNIYTWLIVILVVVGAIIRFCEGIYQTTVPISIFAGLITLILIILWAISKDEMLMNAALVCLGITLLLVIISFVSFQIAYNFGNSQIGNVSKSFFDQYTTYKLS